MANTLGYVQKKLPIFLNIALYKKFIKRFLNQIKNYTL